jgi:hypothetical protein
LQNAKIFRPTDCPTEIAFVGDTPVRFERQSASGFQELAETMMKVDADAAIKAFGAALQAGLPLPDAKSGAA